MTKIMIHVLLFIIILLFGCTKDPYISDLNKDRSERDVWFKFSEHSPLPENVRKDFTGLQYFQPNTSMKLKATLSEDKTVSAIYGVTIDGDSVRFKGYGHIVFEIKGEKHQITAFIPPRELRRSNRNAVLFVPFFDKTNGDLTFSGGRYIDIKMPENDEAFYIDFNKAYNPFCAYNEEFLCPQPPEQNFLEFAVKAGEKKWSPPTARQ